MDDGSLPETTESVNSPGNSARTEEKKVSLDKSMHRTVEDNGRRARVLGT